MGGIYSAVLINNKSHTILVGCFSAENRLRIKRLFRLNSNIALILVHSSAHFQFTVIRLMIMELVIKFKLRFPLKTVFKNNLKLYLLTPFVKVWKMLNYSYTLRTQLLQDKDNIHRHSPRGSAFPTVQLFILSF